MSLNPLKEIYDADTVYSGRTQEVLDLGSIRPAFNTPYTDNLKYKIERVYTITIKESYLQRLLKDVVEYDEQRMIRDKHPAVKDLYEQYQEALALTKKWD